ncbi:lema family protein [Variovorax ginsengisoli]|uniref:LemA protein n=1 Tax=Variovorax ginsengisoli TaxID=363844 RepID=A0ABT9SEZ0_9BURK|nr:lema family protein [Variovorax ginsengisoli]MDP9901912.1 LemA protein [Variovorax ginsengisoli]
MSHLPDSLGGWLAAAVLLFWFVGAHNRLVRLRSAALQAYVTLDAALVRQVDAIQSHVLARTEAPPPGGVDEAGLASLRATAEQLRTVLGATRVRPLDPAGMAAQGTALQVMQATWTRLQASGGDAQAAAMAWPDPAALPETARAQFNLNVAQYNAAIRQFPAVLVAWVMQLRPAATLG